jgi:hypothetical protein
MFRKIVYTVFYRLRNLGCSDSVIRLHYVKVQITVAGWAANLSETNKYCNPLKERPSLATEAEDKKIRLFTLMRIRSDSSSK